MVSSEPIHAAVLHGLAQTPRHEPFPAPVAGDGEVVAYPRDVATAAASQVRVAR